MTLAVAQPASAQPFCDGEDPPPICYGGEEPPPPTGYVPILALDLVQQTTSQTGVRVAGWAADDDAPTISLTVSITIDGASAGSTTANGYRSDVAAAYPRFGSAHGFDLVLPASAAGHNICVTAVSVGGGSNKTSCRQMDTVASFEASGISYDTANYRLIGTSLEQLDKVSTTNATTVQQSTEISGTRTSTNSEGWSDTRGISVTLSAGFMTGIPILAQGQVTMTATGSYSFTRNGSTQRTQSFTWRQPVIVPAMSRVDATVTVTHSTISVPYTMTGSFLYTSGARAAGSIGGTFTGGNSDYLQVDLRQYNLDGTPASAPAQQPSPALLKSTQLQ